VSEWIVLTSKPLTLTNSLSMSLAYTDFLAERGVTLAELTTEQKLAMSADYTTYLQTQTGNIIIPPHIYLSIPLLFNETNTMVSIIYYSLTAPATATAAPGM
jgi:hypothetical protein